MSFEIVLHYPLAIKFMKETDKEYSILLTRTLAYRPSLARPQQI